MLQCLDTIGEVTEGHLAILKGNLRGAGGWSDQCSVKACVNRKLFWSLKTDRETLIRTVYGSEFQTDVAENWKACLEKSVVGPATGLQMDIGFDCRHILQFVGGLVQQ